MEPVEVLAMQDAGWIYLVMLQIAAVIIISCYEMEVQWYVGGWHRQSMFCSVQDMSCKDLGTQE